MNSDIRGILYGLALGDGNLYTTLNNFGNEYTVLTIGHTPVQKEYIEYKADLVTSCVGGKRPAVTSYSSTNRKTGNTYTNLQFRKTNKYFKQMREVLYKNNSKLYTRKMLDYLTDHGLSLWFMDDGSGTVCKNRRGDICGVMTRISTYCTLNEALVIKEWFRDKYSLEVSFDVDKRSNKYSIRMNKDASIEFVKIVSPYIIESMKYKINHINVYNTRAPDTPLLTEG